MPTSKSRQGGRSSKESGEFVGTTARSRLILEHLPSVRRIARTYHEKVPGSCSLDDLVSAGVLGLVSAVDDFDATKPVAFGKFAEYRISTAIRDSLRDMHRPSVKQRERLRRIEAAKSTLQQRNMQSPGEADIASQLGISLETFRSWKLDLVGVFPDLSDLDEAAPEDPDISSLSEATSSEALVRRRELQEILASAIGRLPPLEQRVVDLHYSYDMAIREIAAILELPPSRISELKSKAIKRMRSLLEVARREPTRVDDRHVNERADLLAKKYQVGLASKEAARLANIDQLLEQDETRQADLIDAHEDERLARIDAGLARVEKAIQELRALKTQ